MKYAWVAIFLPFIAACQTTKISEPIAAFSQFPLTCPWRASFPGQVEFVDESTKPGLVPGTKRIIVRAKGDYRQFVVGCVCNDKFNFSRMKQNDALRLNDFDLKPDGFERTEFSFDETGFRKEFSYSAKADSYLGKFIRKGKAHFQGNCVNMVESVALEQDIAAVDQFLRTIRDTRDSPVASPNSSPQKIPFDSKSTRERLEVIKDLLERNIITKEEYNERRRSILDKL